MGFSFTPSEIPDSKELIRKLGIPLYPQPIVLKDKGEDFLGKLLGSHIYVVPKHTTGPLIVFLHGDKIIFHAESNVGAYQNALLSFMIMEFKDRLPLLLNLLMHNVAVYCEFKAKEGGSEIEGLTILDAYSINEKQFLLPEIVAERARGLDLIEFEKLQVSGTQELLSKLEELSEKEVFIKKYSGTLTIISV